MNKILKHFAKGTIYALIGYVTILLVYFISKHLFSVKFHVTFEDTIYIGIICSISLFVTGVAFSIEKESGGKQK